jgi:hypothetical protein
MNQAVHTRRNDIDWLRVIATYLFLVFSAARVFDADPAYHVKNPEVSGVFSWLTFFLSQWLPMLFFVLAGWSHRTSLQARKGMESLRERILRLFVPLVFGCLLVCPAIVYVESRQGLPAAARPSLQAGDATGSILPFLQDFFTRLDIFTWAHLWFLAYLFVFTLVSWPFFSWLLHRKIMPLKIGPVFVYLPMVPLALIRLDPGVNWPHPGAVFHDQAGLLFFFACFVLGFVISRYSAYERAMDREYRRAGFLGAGLLILPLLLAPDPSLPVISMTGSAAGWCLVVWVMGLARSRLEHGTVCPLPLRESTLPVYVLHLLPVVVLGSFLIVPLDAGIAVKFALLLFLSAGITLAMYYLGIRRVPALRRLFGMKPEHPSGEHWKDQASNRV